MQKITYICFTKTLETSKERITAIFYYQNWYWYRHVSINLKDEDIPIRYYSKIQRFSKRLDDLTILTNQHWVVVDEILTTKSIYIFRTNGELLISQSGKVQKAKWEYLGNNSLLIDELDESYLFKHGFIDSNILALKVDCKNEYAFLVNENKYDGELNSIDKVVDFLRINYLDPSVYKGLEGHKKLNLPLEKISFPYKKINTSVALFL